MARRDGHATGMAGEFFVMEKLFRLGHMPALTLGHSKMIDILVNTSAGDVCKVSVKAICGGEKWGVGTYDYSKSRDLFFVLLLYKAFEQVETQPVAYIVPARKVERLKRQWFDQYAVYLSHGQ